ncbi:hypothetical protein P3T76_008027 [Phytophthora citrophthora]|uniref:Uncharacterized protein n=1 Tax=Phytophthora citrophthora TaxID=4793 RepID=A0AAD9GMC5_9STRA|nr:hypothetical protein P3T76_008027 [Phytophthora citrophthora]
MGVAVTHRELLQQFDMPIRNDSPPERVLEWGHPALIRLLAYADVSVFIEGTFHCVPSEFCQCVLNMIYDRASNAACPVCGSSFASKSEWSYWHALHLLKVSTDMNMERGTVTYDFEQTPIKDVGDQFTEATALGCLFHFKQAIRRRMAKLHFLTKEISVAMRPQMLDVLTILPHEQINPQGVEHTTVWIKEEDKGCGYSEGKCEGFWRYF